MADTTIILKSDPGIKRDGTKFDGNFYTDGQWCRFQRGMPRKIGGYKLSQEYLTEVSRGFTSYTQQLFLYCHSGGATKLERYTMDSGMNSSLVVERQPVAVKATGTVTLTGGGSGSVDSIKVNGVEVMSGAVSFVTDLPLTAAAVAANINAHTSSPEYTAYAIGAVITITAAIAGTASNTFVVTPTATTITTSKTDMAGGLDAATKATGSVTLLTGAGGSVDSIKVDGVEIMSASEPYDTSLAHTATHVASNINAHTSSPDYFAVAVGAVITITATVGGMAPNGFVILVSATTITTSKTDMVGGSDALVVSVNNTWMFDYMFDSSTSANTLIAHVAPNLSCIANSIGGQIFYGDVIETTAMKSINLPAGANCTGGVVALHPYLFYYGTDGIIGWSMPGEPSKLTGTGSGLARVWGQKIIKGMPLRAGSGSAPAGLFWAYDAVIRASFVGGNSQFQFDVIACDTSIMSPSSVVEYDGVFFWAGTDRFLMFNGVVREVPNAMNLNYFFDNINRAQRGNVFAFKNTRYGEIWWCYPFGEAEECTHAVIYNVRENSWYDTVLPNGGRSAGGFNNSLSAPILTGVFHEEYEATYSVWVHETGMDEATPHAVSPIPSWFETADLSSLVQGKSEVIRITRIEPDFIQTGEMSVQVTGRANARAQEVYSSRFTFPETATEAYQQIVVMKEQRRELRVRFESNAVGGNYQMGQIIGHVSPGDHTTLG